MILNETRAPSGTSLNVISYRSGGTGCSDMPAKFRQLGWMWVAPTPDTQAAAEGGKSDRRVVDPRNTIRTVAAVWFEEGVGDAGVSLHATGARLAMVTMARSIVRT